MTHRQKTIGITAAVVVSVLTFTTYNPIGNRFLSSSSAGGHLTAKKLLNQLPNAKKDTLLYQKKRADQSAPGYNNPMED